MDTSLTLTFRATLNEAQRQTLVNELQFYARAIAGMAGDLGVKVVQVSLHCDTLCGGREQLPTK
jgi:hypothetical protein